MWQWKKRAVMEQILPSEVLQEKSQHKAPGWAEDEVRKEKQEREGGSQQAQTVCKAGHQTWCSTAIERGRKAGPEAVCPITALTRLKM